MEDIKHSTVPARLRVPTFPIDEVVGAISIDGKFYTPSEFRNLKNLKVVGDLDLSNTNITSLPDGLEVGRDLTLRGTKGRLDLSYTTVTSLPDGLEVGGYLDLHSTKITSLPDDLEVGGDLILSGTKITSLPDGLKVGENLYLYGTPLAGKITSHPGVKGSLLI